MITPRQSEIARYAAYWAYQQDGTTIDALTAGYANAIVKGCHDTQGRIPIPTRRHRPDERY